MREIPPISTHTGQNQDVFKPKCLPLRVDDKRKDLPHEKFRR
jgi:hypothetical protein